MKINIDIIFNIYSKLFGSNILEEIENSPFEYKVERLMSSGRAFCHERNDQVHGYDRAGKSLYMFPDMLKEALQHHGY